MTSSKSTSKTIKPEENNKDKNLVINFFNKYSAVIYTILVLFFSGMLIMVIAFNVSEKRELYKSHYYIYSIINEKTMVPTSERKHKFQLKVIGLMKEAGTNMLDDELIAYTSYVFDRSEEYLWDPYLAIAFAGVETGFIKNMLGKTDDRGLYQFISTTAKLIADKDYYTGIEYNVLDSTKMWFKYMKILCDYFEGNLEYAILAYNIGERNVVRYSGLKKNKENWDFKTGNLNLIITRYYGAKEKSYLYKVFKYMHYAKVYGTSEQFKIK